MLEDKVGEYLNVIEHPRVKEWFFTLIERPIDFSLLTQNNVNFFTERYGVPLSNKGNSSYGNVWHILEKNNFEIKALSGKKGSLYVCKTFATRDEFKQDEELGKAIISFLEKVILALKGQE